MEKIWIGRGWQVNTISSNQKIKFNRWFISKHTMSSAKIQGEFEALPRNVIFDKKHNDLSKPLGWIQKRRILNGKTFISIIKRHRHILRTSNWAFEKGKICCWRKLLKKLKIKFYLSHLCIVSRFKALCMDQKSLWHYIKKLICVVKTEVVYEFHYRNIEHEKWLHLQQIFPRFDVYSNFSLKK